MSDNADRMIEFEEQNFDRLIDKFLQIKAVRDLWEDFVYNEYEDSLRDFEPDHGER